jgi:flagella basal body P-ring formation protein FlgA
MNFKLLTVLLLTSSLALAQPAGPRQDLAALKAVVLDYLQAQSAGLPGEASIEVGAIDSRMSLAACPAPQAFQQPGARAWGKTTVGVRWAWRWTVYISAGVRCRATTLPPPCRWPGPADPAISWCCERRLASMPGNATWRRRSGGTRFLCRPARRCGSTR